jgi:mRNA-degrading endonuclease RelE of RelBE toxin-antitoxin system
MSQQKFENPDREALWDTHGRKCFHCGCALLLLREMEVEHIIPESLADDQQALAELLKRIGLDPGFDVRGFENLAPSCKLCNSRKSDSLLPDRAIVIALTDIKRKLPALEKRLQKQQVARSIESVLRTIDKSIRAGKFTKGALLRELACSIESPKKAQEPQRPIAWSARALADLKRLGSSADEIFLRLQNSIEHGQIDATKVLDGHHTYKIRIGGSGRLLFRVRPDVVEIIAIYSKREAVDLELKRLLLRGG